MADAITIKALQDASLDAKSLEEVVNGDAATTVLSRLGETYPTLSNALNQIDSKLDSADAQVKQGITSLFENGGLPATPFKTKALMTASALVDGQYAMVTDDVDDKNGFYIKESGQWVKSKYDVIGWLGQFISNNNSIYSNLFVYLDADGNVIKRTSVDGKHYFYGLDSDLKTELTRYVDSSATSPYIFEVKDSEGRITLYQDSTGDICSLTDGNISESIRSIREGLTGSSGNGGKDYARASEYADQAVVDLITPYKDSGSLITAAQVNDLGLFPHPIRCVRIPAVTRISKTEYLMFFEARETSSDYSVISVGSCRITIGEDKKPVVDRIVKIDQPFNEGELAYSLMNPCGVLLDSGRVICLYVARSGSLNHKLFMKYSDDGGLTWEGFRDISNFYVSTRNWNMVCPCTLGIVKRFGVNKGRIVFPIWTSGVGWVSGAARCGYIYSDDNGDTWNVGEMIENVVAAEPQLAENINGDLVFTLRDGYPPEPKKIYVLDDKTKIYKRVAIDQRFTDARIMSGLIQCQNEFDNSPPKIITTSCKTLARSGLMVHTSYDGGETWYEYEDTSLQNTGVQYTCVDNIDGHTKFIVRETASTSSIDYTILTLNYLLEK